MIPLLSLSSQMREEARSAQRESNHKETDYSRMLYVDGTRHGLEHAADLIDTALASFRESVTGMMHPITPNMQIDADQTDYNETCAHNRALADVLALITPASEEEKK